jgi:hypothetical protein
LLMLSELKRILCRGQLEGAAENPVHRGVVLRAAEGEGSAKRGELTMSREMILKIVAQMIKVMLTHHLCVYNCGGNSRKIHPSNIAGKEFDVRASEMLSRRHRQRVEIPRAERHA